MRVAVKLFGGIREAVGEKELSVELPDGASARDLRRRLADRYPIFDTFGDRLAVSVQLEVVPLDTALRDGDEVAFLPPVSGGRGHVLDLRPPAGRGRRGGAGERARDGRDRHVRGRGPRPRARPLDPHLEYEAYPEMAVREMEKIAAQVEQRWPGTRVAIGHRSGHLEVGEIAVVIAAAARRTAPPRSRRAASRSTR
jgi:molybdopterin synthase catalytic subunit